MTEPNPDMARKDALRAAAFARRREAHAAAAARVPAANARLLTLIAEGPAPRMVAGYMPIRTEMDPRPALEGLAAQGAPLCLPVVTGKARPLIFRRWAPGEALVDGAFGAAIPADTAPEVAPDLLILPLVGFDRSGGRLGYGGGFYDRTLEALRAAAPAASPVRAIGFAYAAQEAEALPQEATDQPMDAMVTEAETLRFG